jgi:hypothetical protein
VVVAVREAPFRTIRFGPGLGFQAIRWDAQALFGWQHRNFFGELRRVGTDARVGYAWLPNPFNPTKQGTVGLAGVEFSQPGALTRYVDTAVRLEFEKGIEQAYDFYSERLTLALPLRLASRWTLVPSYNLEVYEVSNYGVTFDPSAPVGGRTLENCRGNVCLLTYLEQRIAWDGRDNPVNTRRGLYVGSRCGGVSGPLRLSLPEVPAGAARFLAVRHPDGPRRARPHRGAHPGSRAGRATDRRALHGRRPPLDARLLHAAAGEDGAPGERVGAGRRQRARGRERRAPLRRDQEPGLRALPRRERLRLLGGAEHVGDGVDRRSCSGRRGSGSATGRRSDRYGWTSACGCRRTYGRPPRPYTFWPDGERHFEPIVAVHLSLGEAF